MSLADPRPNSPRAGMTRVGRSLRLVLRRGASETAESVAETPAVPSDVEFVAYAEDCLVTGRIALSAERLTDLLNAHDEYALVNVVVSGLEDGRELEVPEVTLLRDDLLIAQANEPRGNAGRRRATRKYGVAMQVGPYLLRGFLHALPGSDAVSSLGRRKTMVPLTDVWVDFVSAGEPQHRHLSTAIVNQERIEWVVEDGGEPVVLRHRTTEGDEAPTSA
ncbi:MAG TPA: hypothetical protein VH813_00770 [Candidatus Limnocylindrales bacterium]|jgi:hypothetical protein